jgi:hypothetical protein
MAFVACMGAIRNTTIQPENPEGRYLWDVKMDLEGTECGVQWIQLAQKWAQWWILVGT